MKLFIRLLLIGLLLSTGLDLSIQPVSALQTVCGLSAVINVAAGTTGTIATPDPGQSIGVCGFIVTSDTAATGAQFKTGTGASCATNCVNQTGVLRMVVNGSITYGNANAELFSSGTGNAVYVAATTGAVTGTMSYRMRP